MSDEPGPHQHPLDPGRVATVRDSVPPADAVVGIMARLSLVTDVTRLRLLLALRAAGELCVGDLALALAISDDAASYGLRMLRAGGLVTFRRDGRVVYYRMADDSAGPLLDDVLAMAGAPWRGRGRRAR